MQHRADSATSAVRQLVTSVMELSVGQACGADVRGGNLGATRMAWHDLTDARLCLWLNYRPFPQLTRPCADGRRGYRLA
jgi:hypothetical protein